MTSASPTSRSGYRGVIIVWVAAAVVALAIGLAAPSDWRAAWMPVGLAGCMILAFVIQFFAGGADGFLRRVAASVLGAMAVMGLIGLGLSLASLFAG